jgi:hypothetical protein
VGTPEVAWQGPNENTSLLRACGQKELLAAKHRFDQGSPTSGLIVRRPGSRRNRLTGTRPALSRLVYQSAVEIRCRNSGGLMELVAGFTWLPAVASRSCQAAQQQVLRLASPVWRGMENMLYSIRNAPYRRWTVA